MYRPSPLGAVYVIPSVAPTRTPDGVDDERDRLSQILTYPSSAPETSTLVEDSSAKHTALTVDQYIVPNRYEALTIVSVSWDSERPFLGLDIVNHDLTIPSSRYHFFAVRREPDTPNLVNQLTSPEKHL
jgi:hypothetical protein